MGEKTFGIIEEKFEEARRRFRENANKALESDDTSYEYVKKVTSSLYDDMGTMEFLWKYDLEPYGTVNDTVAYLCYSNNWWGVLEGLDDEVYAHLEELNKKAFEEAEKALDPVDDKDEYERSMDLQNLLWEANEEELAEEDEEAEEDEDDEVE